MNRQAKELTLALAALAVLLLLPAAVKADPIVITLDDARTVASGFTVTFQGTLANTGPGNRYVNAVGFSFSGGFADFTFDPSDFFAAVPQFFPTGSATPGFPVPVDFFDLIVSASVAPGTYTGSFSVLGTSCDPNDPMCMETDTTLGTQDFTLVVQGAGAAVPEPATMFLLATGLGGAALAKRRARRKEKANTDS